MWQRNSKVQYLVLFSMFKVQKRKFNFQLTPLNKVLNTINCITISIGYEPIEGEQNKPNGGSKKQYFREIFGASCRPQPQRRHP